MVRRCEVADDRAIQRDKRERGVGDGVPFPSKGSDHIEREAQGIENDWPAKIVQVLQPVRDRVEDGNAALDFKHGRAIEVRDDSPLMHKPRRGQKGSKLVINALG